MLSTLVVGQNIEGDTSKKNHEPASRSINEASSKTIHEKSPKKGKPSQLKHVLTSFLGIKKTVDHLPEKVKAHMKQAYPDVDIKKMSWHENFSHNYNDIFYQANFEHNGLEVSIELDYHGVVHAKETELQKKDTPKDLAFFIQGHVINYVAYIEYHDEEPLYVIESSYKNYKFTRAFNTNGTLIGGDKRFSLIGYKAD